MEILDKNRNVESGEYKLCYRQGQPYSLTVTKKPSTIQGYLFTLPKYIWIMTSKMSVSSLQIQEGVGKRVIFARSMQEAEIEIHKQKMVVIICHQSVIENIFINFQSLIKNQKINGIVCYGSQSMKVSHQIINYVGTENEAIDLIKKKQSQFRKQNEFINFISLDKQAWDSNILCQTMFLMASHKSSFQQLMKQFQELALICDLGSANDIEEFVSQYQNQNAPGFSVQSAIKWYTRQSFLYIFINRLLRISKDPTCLYIIQPFFSCLFVAINSLYVDQTKHKSFKKFVCYRGAKVSQKELTFFKEHKGLVIQNLGFMSTSRIQSIAKKFMGNVLFQIDINDEERHPLFDFGYAYINKYSHFAEQQVLFNTLNTFKVVGIECIDRGKKLYKIYLKYGQMARILSCDSDDLNQQQLHYRSLGQHQMHSIKSSSASMGSLLIQNRFNLQGSQQFCNKFLQIAKTSNDYLAVVDGHYLKGKSAQNKGNYKKMLKEYTECQKIFIERNDQHSEQYINVINCLGNCYYFLGQYHKAVEYFTKCEFFWKPTSDSQSNSKYDIILNSLGTCYNYLGQFKLAIEYIKSSLNIREKTYGKNHPLCADLFGVLGNIYLDMGQFKKGTQYLTQYQKVKKLTLGQNHPEYPIILNNLAISLLFMHQVQKAGKYFEKCSKLVKRMDKNHPNCIRIVDNIINFNERIYQSSCSNYIDFLTI